MLDHIVVGKGLIGTATARYLSSIGKKVAVIGPDEPSRWSSHRGVFASHYDQGRITRILDPDPIWAILAERSIQQYPAIEQQSGIRFHYNVGGLRVGPLSGDPEVRIDRIEAVGQRLGAAFKKHEGKNLQAIYPWFEFPEGQAALLEGGQAGYINPRSLVEAQLKIARLQGAAIITETVVSIEKRQGAVEVRTVAGQKLQARKVLVAAGAYTNQLLETKLKLELRARTILLAEVSSAEMRRLSDMPTLIYRLQSDGPVNAIYMVPPVQYPDGKYYIKIGGGGDAFITVDSQNALLNWFHTDGSPAEAEALKEILLSIIPSLEAVSFHSKPCVTTYTAHDHPYIDTIEPGQIYVAAGGCGAAAKSSNEIGRVAATLAENDAWIYDIEAELFEAVE